MPAYRAVAELISQRIESGQWKTGTTLPPEIALAQEFRVSVGTIRRALGELTADGVLVRRRKTGTVVTGRTPHHSLRFFYKHFRLHSRAGGLQNSTAQVLRLERRPASVSEAGRLGLPEGSLLREIHRLRIVGTRPVMHERVLLPDALVPGLTEDIASFPQWIYTMLWQDYGIRISAVREQLEAELATEQDCHLLKLEPPAAVLVLQEVAYDETARPVLLNDHRATTREDVYINEIQ